MNRTCTLGDWRITKNSMGVWAVKYISQGDFDTDIVIKNISDVLDFHEIGDNAELWTDGEAIMVLLAI